MLKKIKLNTPLGSVIDVYENPTEEEFVLIKKRFREVYPKSLIDRYELPKSITDDLGNMYFWMYGDATHPMVMERLKAIHSDRF